MYSDLYPLKSSWPSPLVKISKDFLVNIANDCCSSFDHIHIGHIVIVSSNDIGSWVPRSRSTNKAVADLTEFFIYRFREIRLHFRYLHRSSPVFVR